MESLVTDIIDSHVSAVSGVRAQAALIARLGNLLVDCLRRDGRIYLCGNGGSAADAQHIATEFACRYEAERQALPAIALTTDTSMLTATGNDYGFERIFARQIEALARAGDVLLAISTSGNSPNVLAAVDAARDRRVVTIGLLGRTGGELSARVDHALVVPSENTARIQECHIMIGHIWCAMADRAFAHSA